DYALGTRGGRILPGHTSQTFIKGAKGMISKWWLKRTRPQPSPLLAITPDAYVGHCWPMDGDQGSLGIHLAEPIFITSMTIEYPSHNLLNHKMSSAPKEVELWGLKHDTTNAIYLGSFTYDIKSSSSSIQTFTLDQHQDILFEGAVLRILSNWGNKDHTCLYRIRIHG
ncbi:UNC-like C-terminal-domain-containing protein, partial [Cunninghamella echinulata]